MFKTVILAVVLVLAIVVGCGKTSEPTAQQPTPSEFSGNAQTAPALGDDASVPEDSGDTEDEHDVVVNTD